MQQVGLTLHWTSLDSDAERVIRVSKSCLEHVLSPGMSPKEGTEVEFHITITFWIGDFPTIEFKAYFLSGKWMEKHGVQCMSCGLPLPHYDSRADYCGKCTACGRVTYLGLGEIVFGLYCVFMLLPIIHQPYLMSEKWKHSVSWKCSLRDPVDPSSIRV